MKKTLSIILAILMIVTSVPFAFAAGYYEITHQPTVDELYVETDDRYATYQWYEVESGKVIDDTVATPIVGADFGLNGASYYDTDSGVWVPIYDSEEGYRQMLFFSIPLKKGEAVSVECSGDVLYSNYANSEGRGMQFEGGKSTFTAENDDVYYFFAIGNSPVQATARFLMQTAVEGATSAQLNNYEPGKRYVCYATFLNGTSERSDEVYTHQHTSTELTCMGYKCTICGSYFGEETANHSFTNYIVTTLPTGKKPGVKKATCDYGCGTVDEQSIPAGSTAIDVVYDEDGNRIGFKAITADGKMYYDIFDGNGGAIEDLSVGDFYVEALTTGVPKWRITLGDDIYDTTIADAWAGVASNVFQAAGRGYGWNYEFEDFNEMYATNTKENKSDVILAECLGSTLPYATGDLKDDCVRSTGLQAYSSLNLVQDVMLDQIVDVCGERNDAEAFKEVVLEFCTGDKEGFELFKNKDEQVVVANIVTSLEEDSALERDFSTFGIAYYDFKLTPIIEENLQYISAADNYETLKDAFENNAPGVSYTDDGAGSTSISYIQNPTSAPASVSASSSKSTTNSVSNSFSESESHSFSKSISTNFELTPIKDFFKFSVNVGFSASDSVSTAFSESTSISETTSTSSSASVTLPAYTELGIKQTMSSIEQAVEYDCPVYLTYKVAVFGVNAQYIQDAETGSWSITNYDQGCIFTSFGSDSIIGGISAVDNLYNRWNESSKAFELSYGNTFGQWEDQNDGNPPLKINYIDWSKVDKQSVWDEYITDMKNNIPMSSVGGTMVFKTESINTEITSIYPIYDLKRIRFEGNGAYTLGIGGKLDLNTVNTVGLNEFDQPYYGFLGRMGTWYVCDKDGNDVTYEEGKGISLEPTPSTQTIIAHELGEYYVRFDIDEEFYTKAADRKTYITNDDLEFTAILKLSVTDTGNNHTCRPGGWITYIPANCVVEGERYRNCLTCSKRMATEVIPKADHVPVEVVTPATCTTDGSKTTTCLTCKTIISNEVIPAKGHGKTYSVTTVTPTCTRDGEKALYCLDCNNLVGSETIASTGHDNGVWKVDFEATPEHEGQMTKYCSTCNYALESKTFAYHTHAYTSWRTNNDGTHARNCYLCGYTEINECDYNETVTPATCTVDGKTTYQCKDCKHKYSETSSYAQGHSWGTWTASEDGNHSASCMVCGESEASPHIFVEYIPNNDATKDSDGTKTATCVVCAAKDTVIDEGSKLVDTPDDSTDDCSHICHSTGISGFFWKIIRIFWKLFRMNPVCECGAAHY